MLNLKAQGIGILALSALSLTANAVPIGTVGTKDSLIGYSLQLSGSGAEETWIEGILGFDVTYTQLNNSGGSDWETVTGVGAIAGDVAFDFGIGNEPEYYLVKTGNLQISPDYRVFLYDNAATMQWAFLNYNDFNPEDDQDFSINIGKISHVGRTGGSSTSSTSSSGTEVPEPSSGSLIALGLLCFGMVAWMRRTRKETVSLS